MSIIDVDRDPNCIGLYVVRDIIADDIGPVFQAKNDGVAVRSFRGLLKDVVNIDEYELIRIGHLERDTMKLFSDVSKVLVKIPALEVVNE